jgi:sulfide:quinone oxidoreductase
MAFKPLTPTLSVSAQPYAADVAAAARAGFRGLISNRPDGEEPGQPTAAEMRALAAAHGMGFAHVPVVPGQIGDEDVALMADALVRLDGPVLAFCRTGTRAAMLWALNEAGREAGREAGARPVGEIIETAAAAGYDLSALRPRLADATARPKPSTAA